MINYITYHDAKAQGRCRLTISNELEAYNQLPFQMGFPIGNPIAYAFDEYLIINYINIIHYVMVSYFEWNTQIFSSHEFCWLVWPLQKKLLACG